MFFRSLPCPRTLGNPRGGLGAASPQLIPLFKDIFPYGYVAYRYVLVLIRCVWRIDTCVAAQLSPCTPLHHPNLGQFPTSSFKDFLPLRGCFGCRSASLCPSSLLVRFLVSLVPFAFLRFLATAWSSASLSVRSFLCLPASFFLLTRELRSVRPQVLSFSRN